jgi:hypothetical protein
MAYLLPREPTSDHALLRVSGAAGTKGRTDRISREGSTKFQRNSNSEIQNTKPGGGISAQQAQLVEPANSAGWTHQSEIRNQKSEILNSP